MYLFVEETVGGLDVVAAEIVNDAVVVSCPSLAHLCHLDLFLHLGHHVLADECSVLLSLVPVLPLDADVLRRLPFQRRSVDV